MRKEDHNDIPLPTPPPLAYYSVSHLQFAISPPPTSQPPEHPPTPRYRNLQRRCMSNPMNDFIHVSPKQIYNIQKFKNSLHTRCKQNR